MRAVLEWGTLDAWLRGSALMSADSERALQLYRDLSQLHEQAEVLNSIGEL